MTPALMAAGRKYFHTMIETDSGPDPEEITYAYQKNDLQQAHADFMHLVQNT